MNIIVLKERTSTIESNKFNQLYSQFRGLLSILNETKLPNILVEAINQDVQEINSSYLPDKALKKLVKQKQTKILKAVEKDLKIVPKNYYRNLWQVVGMSVFGLPIGVALGLVVGNIGLLAIGLPIGE